MGLNSFNLKSLDFKSIGLNSFNLKLLDFKSIGLNSLKASKLKRSRLTLLNFFKGTSIF